MDAESVKVDYDEDGMHLVIETAGGDTYDFNIQGIAEQVYDAVKGGIGPWLQERDQAERTFRCNPDESGGYAEYDDVVSVWDDREKIQ